MFPDPDSAPEFDDECAWPRRLLHIPTLTSVPWAAGNFYGSDCEPRYIALSYTWGRWRLETGDRVDVPALPVKNVTWDTPRVQPEHFTAAELRNVLESAPRVFSESQDVPDALIEYAWLDVACINQTAGAVEMALEVGRQAKIFKGATMTFVWLTTLSENEYLAQREKNEQVAKQKKALATTRLEQQRAGWDSIRAEVEDLTSDPWFSSLWTLQEAYLAPHAFIMTRKGEWLDSMILDRFIEYCQLMQGIVLHDQLYAPDPSVRNDECLLKLKKALDHSGVSGLTWQLPLTLLGAARYRKTTRAEDRVYGIMQVFGFRLGKSRPGVDPSRKFDMTELEDELGRELLEREPIMSQMHIHAELPPVGQGWRITSTSEQTRKLRLISYGPNRPPIKDLGVQVQLSTVNLGGTLWGSFNGRLCAFSKLAHAWESFGAFGSGNGIVDLDCSQHTIVNNPKQILQEALDLSYSHPDAAVLLLGKNDNLNVALGLLLAPRPVEAERLERADIWQRLGLCEWSTRAESAAGTDGETDTAALYGGTSSDWSSCTGVFG
ncbi:heterokaryon incompatibility protein-domain-containing protein [Plectosphaerella plurivora]|uniref:Heterokaryon incompatibility protein-domain-containing protein n=1 Tax=Plectosphaerella plurivora TaxID=936078 RepID=A0A9P8VAW5_9PEZI|nr:heterokaryon incompatibility protein-domain-containing protein [Plectosphaerella plurivora]